MGLAAILIVICTVIANLLIASITYYNNPKSWTNRFLSLLAVILGSWTMANFFAISPGTETARLFWVRIVMFVTGPMGATTYLLAAVFPAEKLTVNKKMLLYTTISVPIVMLLGLSPWMFSSLQNLPNNNFGLSPGPAIILFAFNHFMFTILGFIILFKKFKKSGGRERQQLVWFLIGNILTLALITLTNFVAVVFFNSIQYTFVGPTFTLFQVGFTAYAIVRHRLLDIRFLVARTVSYSILIGVIVLVYSTSLAAASNAFPKAQQVPISTGVTLLFVFSFNSIRRIIEDLTEGIFHKKSYIPEELLEALGDIVRSTLSLETLTQKIAGELEDTMHVSKISFILTQKNAPYLTKSFGYQNDLELSMDRINQVLARSRGNPLVFEDLLEGPTKKLMRELQVSVFLPLIIKDTNHGLIAIGEKSSGDVYDQQDLDVFGIMTPQIAIAIQNALAFDEIHRFNITLRKKVDEATTDLRHANKNLRHLDKLKDEFVFIATHELKNPVTAMRGYLSMIQEGTFGKIPPKLAEPIAQLNISNQQLVNLVNDLLQIARSEAKTLSINPEIVKLCPIIDEVSKSVQPLADQKKIKLNHVCPTGGFTVKADPNRLKEIVNNLISNAIKYSDTGTINVAHAKESGHIITHVIDQGRGIPEEAQAKIFTRFFRAEEEVIKGTPGTGLGLFIVKQLVEKMGGKIWFTSKEGKGSTFSFSLPKA